MPVDQFARDAARKAQSDIESHEEICAERYKNINTNISDLKTEIRRGGSIALTIIIALLAWFAVNYISEFKDNMQLRRAMVEQQQVK
ncbi:hypothetical protein [Sphingopyxis sp. GW247-27LB]|uniref:hypothetical protein n=1 Tax=Sphingopyxis sp. GW247-27LB TaxID=2012632 RepID=UPI000BA6DA4E|nr:hypothetical protein [Sphingopyxis sp. GW247-27LB]PAL23552.1 hypothetical protein CD928_05655 [Sphingopyxis sp. GW247-27LB]